MNKKQIIILYLLSIVILLLGLVIVYKNKVKNLTEKTTNPIEGWQTFENKKFGFSFSYPSAYFINKDNNHLVQISNNKNFEKDEYALVITIDLEDGSNFRGSIEPSILEVLNRIGYKELHNYWGNKISGNFNGNPPWGYYQILFPSTPVSKSGILITARIHGSDEYSVNLYGTDNKFASITQQILSNFRFTDSNKEVFSSIQGTDVGSGINEEIDKAQLIVENKKTQSAGEAISCFAPTKETTITSGNFSLKVDTAILNLGEREFASGTIYDGKLVKYTVTNDSLSNSQGLYSLIVLPTFCSCNNVCYQFYYYHYNEKSLTRVRLKNRDGAYLADNVITADKIAVDENNRLETSYYDNVTGKDITSMWLYHFETKELWQVK